MRRQFLLVAVGARPRVLSAEILDVPQPVAHDALRQAASEMGADAPENQAEIVFRVILDRQPAQQHEAAPVLDLPADFLDEWAQRGHLEMLALQSVEADPGRIDAPHGSGDVTQLRRVEVDRVIRRRAEIATVHALGCRIGVAKTGVAGVSLSCAGRTSRLAVIVPASHCLVGLCTAETTPVQPGPAAARHGEFGHESCLQQGSANAAGNQFPCGTLSDHWWARQSTFAERDGNDWEEPIAA